MSDLTILIQQDGKTIGELSSISGELGYTFAGSNFTTFEYSTGRGYIKNSEIEEFREAMRKSYGEPLSDNGADDERR